MKTIKAKKSGVFVEQIQLAFLKCNTNEVLAAFGKAPDLKDAPEVQINKLGIMTWCDLNRITHLDSKIQWCIDNEEYRSAAIGCEYILGANAEKRAIELMEQLFERIESEPDYEYHATSVLPIIADSSIEWEGAPNRKYYVKTSGGYLDSTISSIVEDLRVLGFVYRESLAINFSAGYARAGLPLKSIALLNEFLIEIVTYSDVESFIYSLTKTVDGITRETRSLECPQVDFVSYEFMLMAYDRAKSLASKDDKEALVKLNGFVADFKT